MGGPLFENNNHLGVPLFENNDLGGPLFENNNDGGSLGGNVVVQLEMETQMISIPLF